MKPRTRNGCCYFCGARENLTRDHIPGKLFGVTGAKGGLVLPACRKCNKSWEKDQQFMRLRIVLHVGSKSGARFIRNRELLRLKGRSGRKPQAGRYLRERAKTFSAGGVEYIGLTDSDYEKICNVIRHWAAGLHYSQTGNPASLPETIADTIATPKLDPQKLKKKLQGHQNGVWLASTGVSLALLWGTPAVPRAHGVRSPDSASALRLCARNNCARNLLWLALPSQAAQEEEAFVRRRTG